MTQSSGRILSCDQCYIVGHIGLNFSLAMVKTRNRIVHFLVLFPSGDYNRRSKNMASLSRKLCLEKGAKFDLQWNVTHHFTELSEWPRPNERYRGFWVMD